VVWAVAVYSGSVQWQCTVAVFTLWSREPMRLLWVCHTCSREQTQFPWHFLPVFAIFSRAFFGLRKPFPAANDFATILVSAPVKVVLF
jgi:hypothetical protein